MTLIEELQSLGKDKLKLILNGNKKVIGLRKELKNLNNGKKKTFYISQFLDETNVEYLKLLNKNFYQTLEKVEKKAEKFRNNPSNEDKYGFNNRKQDLKRMAEYMDLAYPPIQEELWETDLEIKLVEKALKNLY